MALDFQVGVDSSDDMPPLEYVGCDGQYSFKEDDKVIVRGVPGASYNGQSGRIATFSQALKEQLRVALDGSGQTVSVKPKYLEKWASGIDNVNSKFAQSAEKAAESDSDDMPPLDYVGRQPQAQSASLVSAAQGDGQAARQALADSSQNPLASNKKQCCSLAVGDVVILHSLKMADLNGKHAIVTKAACASDERVPVQIADNSKKLAVKWANLTRAGEPQVSDAVQSLPPVGTSRETQEDPVHGTAGDAREFRVGNVIVLRGLKAGGFNGQHARIVKLPPSLDERVAVKLLNTGKILSVRRTNLRLIDDLEFDDMPPLEFVGADPAKQYSFREGDMVRLRRLKGFEDKFDGQQGSIMPFEDVPKGFLHVMLDSGKVVIATPERLEKLAKGVATIVPAAGEADSSVAATSPQVDSDSDDVPPLESAAASNAVSSRTTCPQIPSKPPAGIGADSDSDDMPPLESVGRIAGAPTKQAHTSADVPSSRTAARAAAEAPGNDGADSDSDEMPSLDYIGQGAAAGKGTDSDSSDMPPLEYIGQAAVSSAKRTPSSVPPAASGPAFQMAAVDAADSDSDEMPPLENAGQPGQAAHTASSLPPGQAANSDSDEMPPLDYVGKVFIQKQAVGVVPVSKLGAPSNSRDSDSDEMPPLDSCGQGAGAASFLRAARMAGIVAAPAVDSDSDEMPPLEHVGQTGTITDKKGVPSGSAMPTAAGEASDSDEMPPLNHFAHPGSSALTRAHAQNHGPHQHSVGDVVVLRELKAAHLNGKHATVLKSASSANDERVSLKVDDSGQKLSIKFENLRLVKAKCEESSSDDMPPLDYVGQQSVARVTVGMANGIAAASPPAHRPPESCLAREASANASRPFRSSDCTPFEATKALAKEVADFDVRPPVAQAVIAPATKPPAALGPQLGTVSPREPHKRVISNQAASVEEDKAPSDQDWVELGGKTQGMRSCPLSAVLSAKNVQTAAAAAATADKAIKSASNPRRDIANETNIAINGTTDRISSWCKEHNLPLELVDRLLDEEVTDPEELTGLDDKELLELTVGWKMGPKGRFMKLMQRLRACERAEMGSTSYSER